jgi:hypothetical protein
MPSLTLKRLTRRGQNLVTEDFLYGRERTLLTSVDAIEEIPQQVYLNDFMEVINTGLRESGPNDPLYDTEMAKSVHQTLRISRRTAMDPGVWYYLSCAVAPHYVRHRWAKGEKTPRERFLTPLKRNTFWRLWWSAELLVDKGDYGALAYFFDGKQDLYEQLLGRDFSRFPLAAKIFAEILSQEGRETIRNASKDINYILSTVVLETLNEERLRALCLERVAMHRG